MKIYLSFLVILTSISFVWSQSDFDRANELTNQQAFASSSVVLVDYITEHPQRKYAIATAWWLHSYNLLQQGLLNESRQANTTSLDLRKQLRSTDAAYNYLRQAEINMASADFNLALDAALQGMQLMIEDALLYAELNLMCAKALTAMKHYEEAQAYMKTSLDILEIEVGKQHNAYSRYAIQAGFLSLRTHSFDTARNYFKQAYNYGNDTIIRTAAHFFSVLKYE